MNLYIRCFLICLCMVETTNAFAKFYTNSARECYVDDYRNDWFWFCGAQSLSCNGHKVRKKNEVFWRYNGQNFSFDGTTYWCCGGTGEKSGYFIDGASWITKSESVVESFTEGSCTWIKKTNICGQVDNPDSKCTTPTENCNTGYVSHNKKCVLACSDGMAFESATSSNCVACEENIHQGIVQDICVKCGENQIFDASSIRKSLITGSLVRDTACVAKTSKIQVSISTHEACWLCDNPTDLKQCLRVVSDGGDVPTNNTCALNPTNKTDGLNLKLKTPSVTDKYRFDPNKKQSIMQKNSAY